jgi:hypothetical protein
MVRTGANLRICRMPEYWLFRLVASINAVFSGVERTRQKAGRRLSGVSRSFPVLIAATNTRPALRAVPVGVILLIAAALGRAGVATAV